ncbi:MAG: nucleoside kinase [Kiritimatiellia bacterium]|nr:nucleoside kinase [Kiritimatiellia bacterium]
MTIDELNAAVDSGEIDEIIRVCEARQCKELSKIADTITLKPGVRLVQLAGGSSAGKTTTAKRLCTQLRVNGRVAMHMSTDDYFVGDARNPRDENGEFDYETIECVDMPRLAQDLNALLAGETIRPRRFDFIRHEGYDPDFTVSLPPGGMIVLEGIHALNPRLTAAVADNCKFRLFIDPVSQPIVFAFTRLSATDARLLRRLVRDNQFRKMDPMTTFSMWPKVLAGEEKWIKPFRPLADAEFDSALAYEPAVLKPFAQGLLARVRLRGIDDPKVEFLMEFLESVHPTDPTKVPGDSILRETIGGSQLEY